MGIVDVAAFAARTRSILLAVALGAAILGGLTLVWLAVDGDVRPKGASAAPASPQKHGVQ